MEDRPNSRNSVLEEVMDEEPQGDYITLEQLAEIDTTKYPDDLTSPMWLYDAWEIGRQFSAFRIELNQALFHGDEVVEDNDRYSISRILSNMLTMEVYLARHGFVPSILTQIKQHRQRLAEIYLRMDEKLPDND